MLLTTYPPDPPFLHNYEPALHLPLGHHHLPRPAQINLRPSMSKAPAVLLRPADPHGNRHSISRPREDENHGALSLLHNLAALAALHRYKPRHAARTRQ